jgi:Zn-dependent peptidase ImmA (M78 family)
MSTAVADAIRLAASEAGLSWPPGVIAPVPLDRLIAAFNLAHAEVPELTRAAAAGWLERWGVERADLRGDTTALAGFLFANPAAGVILVRRDDLLARRRFSAAHELGHYLLHFLPLLRGSTEETDLVQDDVRETIVEDEETATPLAEMERQANTFAAELLMPEEVCRQLWDQHARRYGPVARFILHHLAGDLLVSREAAHWRLRGLGLIA